MSEQTNDTPFRYTAAMAQQIETRWQDRWEEDGTFNAPNPAGPLGRAGEGRPPAAQKLLRPRHVPVPVAARPARRPPARLHRAPTSTRRFHRMTRQQRPARPGLRRLRPARRAVRRPDRAAPAEDHRGEHAEHAAPAAPPRAGLRRPPHASRRSTTTTTAGRSGSSCRSSTRGTTPTPCARTVAAASAPDQRAGRRSSSPAPRRRRRRSRLGRPVRDRARHGPRRPPPGLHVARRRSTGAPGLGTVLSNEEVTAEGRSERGNFPVFKRNLQPVDDAHHRVRRPPARRPRRRRLAREDQADAAQLDRPRPRARASTSPSSPARRADGIDVFTTRPDTIFGATFMVLAPEHPLVDALVPHGTGPRAPRTPGRGGRRRDAPEEAVAAYQLAASRKGDVERQTEGKDKTGVFTGSYATNPLTGERIPVFVADYVLMGYGTGAIMAVPGQDDARLGVRREVRPPDRPHRPAARGRLGRRARSSATASRSTAPTSDLARRPARRRGQGAHHRLARGARGSARRPISYQLRDWLFSRQRYWGEPFPIVFDEDGVPYAVPDASCR